MKLTLVLLLLSGVVLTACSQTTETLVQEPTYENIPLVDAYYNGEKIWFIHTDVTSVDLAEQLTKMVGFRTTYAPKNAEIIDIENAARFYVFTNGIDMTGTEPWGGGPFGYQIDIFDTVPGDEGYTSVRTPYLVTWKEDARPRILKTVEDLKVTEAKGELTIEPSGIIVNAPVMRWSGKQ